MRGIHIAASFLISVATAGKHLSLDQILMPRDVVLQPGGVTTIIIFAKRTASTTWPLERPLVLKGG
ncbi:MAG TPA: hypothetical protein PK616_08000, partial [Fibrobacteraceae bacterium]|nr:hypothetical protein [Fibrobacteraceae bacterium]